MFLTITKTYSGNARCFIAKATIIHSALANACEITYAVSWLELNLFVCRILKVFDIFSSSILV